MSKPGDDSPGPGFETHLKPGLEPGEVEGESPIDPRLAAKLAEPVRDRSDELLDDPPQGEHHLGRLAGYRAGRPMRRRLAIIMGAATVIIVVIAVKMQWDMHVERQAAEYRRLHPWSLPAEAQSEPRPRTISWSSGKARLALQREAPGAQRIELPDRIIELAEGSDHAQVKFEVRDGKTVAFKVLSGDIVMLHPDGTPMAPPGKKD